ncbi:AarF/UbiB family protein, partial [bacterium]|nr:AarF/UbiB family protein [bacterium]
MSFRTFAACCHKGTMFNMDLIKKGIGLGKTIRNVSRLKEIVSVFAKHGLEEFISGQVTVLIPDFVLPKSSRDLKTELKESPDKNWNHVIGSRLKSCFEELGPSFVKFGQLISSREDLFDEAFIEQMQKLRDDVKGIPFAEVKKEIEKSYEKEIDQIFSKIDEVPIGTASIGLVYKAKLLSGEDVVIKVRRPDIKKLIETDFDILIFLVKQLEKIAEEIKHFGVDRVLEDFSISLQGELNFHREALNANRIKELYEKHDSKKVFTFPKVY